jgi:multidrug efflux pump subunit AcrB
VPQVYVKVDKDAAYARGVGPGQIFSTLQAMLSSLYINDFNLAGRTFRVQAEAESEFRQKPEDIGRFFVRSSHGDMVPLSALVSTEMRGGPSIISRFNGFPSALVTAQPKEGKSSGQLIAAVERLVAEALGVTQKDIQFKVPVAPAALQWALRQLTDLPRPWLMVGVGARWAMLADSDGPR